MLILMVFIVLFIFQIKVHYLYLYYVLQILYWLILIVKLIL